MKRNDWKPQTAQAEKANIEAVKCAQIAQQVAEKKEDCASALKNLDIWRS